MSALKFLWDNDRGSTDVRVENGRFVTDDGLETPTIISLHTNRRADDSEKLEDPGGWWGDEYASAAGREYGSRIWIESNGNATDEVAAAVAAAAEDALAWMVEDGLASSVAAEGVIDDEKRLCVTVTITKPDGTQENILLKNFWENL